jgi:secondary thiamine-phosphate synthase enzyme
MADYTAQDRPGSTRHQTQTKEHNMSTRAPEIPGTNGSNGNNGLGQALQTFATTGDSLQELNGTLKMFSRTIQLVTDSGVELYDITDRIKDLVQSSGINAGFIVLSTLHTTTAVFINEFQAALMADVKHFLERIANREQGYLHNCEDCSDCERQNAEAHIRALVLGHNVTLPIQEGEIPLGQWQSILFAELDGPRERSVTAQVIGV